MIIGLTGKKGVGKDTVGKYLVEHHGFERRAFADKVKEAAAALLNVPVDLIEKHKSNHNAEVSFYEFDHLKEDIGTGFSIFTLRHFLQRVGTEMGREVFGYDFWVDLALPYKPGHRDEDGVWHEYYNADIALTDVRFDNEVDRIEKLGGIIIEIQRPSVDDGDTHVSEQPPVELYDYTIVNEGTLEELYKDVEEVLEDIRANA